MKGWLLSACIVTGLGGCAGAAPGIGPESENRDLQARVQREPEAHKPNAKDLSEEMALQMKQAQRNLDRRQPLSTREQRIGDAAGEMFFEHLVQCSLLFARMSMIMTHLDMAEAADGAAYYSKLFLMPAAEFRGDDWARRMVAKWMRDSEFTEHFKLADNLIAGTDFCLDLADDPEEYLDMLQLHLSTHQ